MTVLIPNKSQHTATFKTGRTFISQTLLVILQLNIHIWHQYRYNFWNFPLSFFSREKTHLVLRSKKQKLSIEVCTHLFYQLLRIIIDIIIIIITKINAITRFVLSHRYDLVKISIKTLTPKWRRKHNFGELQLPWLNFWRRHCSKAEKIFWPKLNRQLKEKMNSSIGSGTDDWQLCPHALKWISNVTSNSFNIFLFVNQLTNLSLSLLTKTAHTQEWDILHTPQIKVET